MNKAKYKQIPIDIVIASLTALAVVGIVGLTLHIVKSIIL